MGLLDTFREILDSPAVGDRVTLVEEIDSIVPAGDYTVSQVNKDGSFHVGGRTAVWPSRIKR